MCVKGRRGEGMEFGGDLGMEWGGGMERAKDGKRTKVGKERKWRKWEREENGN